MELRDRVAWIVLVAVAFVAGFWFACKTGAGLGKEDYRVHVLRVLDGNTFVFEGRFAEQPVRLLYTNTPPRGEPGYQEAKSALAELVEGKTVMLCFEGRGPSLRRDEFGRLRACVWVDGVFVNARMIELGHSSYCRESDMLSRHDRLLREAEARAARRPGKTRDKRPETGDLPAGNGPADGQMGN